MEKLRLAAEQVRATGHPSPAPATRTCRAMPAFKLAHDGHDTRAIQEWLGHQDIRYTELTTKRFKPGFPRWTGPLPAPCADFRCSLNLLR